jgi:hypothetical protein
MIKIISIFCLVEIEMENGNGVVKMEMENGSKEWKIW